VPSYLTMSASAEAEAMGGKGDHYGAHDCAPNPLFYELIDRFRPATGVPMLLNTSLNGKDEPLIETPDDAPLLEILANRHHGHWRCHVQALTTGPSDPRSGFRRPQSNSGSRSPV
jgi:hypothetical protein